MPFTKKKVNLNKLAGKKIPVNSNNESKLYRELLSLLSAPRRYEEIRPVIDQFGVDKNLSANGIYRLKSRVLTEGIGKLPFKWKGSKRTNLYSSASADKQNPVELAVAFNPKSYLCYLTALFWNELTDQVPHTFFIANERPNTYSQGASSIDFDEYELRDAFIKPPRVHPNFAVLGDYRFVFLERAYTGNAGVVTRLVPFLGKNVSIRITGVERTLLDCIASPEDAGGISNVIEALKMAADRFDLEKLVSLYRKSHLKYPHWQRVGLLLEKVVSRKYADTWMANFGTPKSKFYLAKGYKLGWDFDSRWSVYFPKGLFR